MFTILSRKYAKTDVSSALLPVFTFFSTNKKVQKAGTRVSSQCKFVMLFHCFRSIESRFFTQLPRFYKVESCEWISCQSSDLKSKSACSYITSHCDSNKYWFLLKNHVRLSEKKSFSVSPKYIMSSFGGRNSKKVINYPVQPSSSSPSIVIVKSSPPPPSQPILLGNLQPSSSPKFVHYLNLKRGVSAEPQQHLLQAPNSR